MTNSNTRLYNTDLTGTRTANLVLNEAHSLTRQINLAISPIHGAFYTKSMVIKNLDTGLVLLKNVDYRFLEPYPTLRELSGKEVHGIILIRDTNVNPRISLTYQCVGGEYAMTAGALVELLNSMPDVNPDFSWYGVLLAESDEEIQDGDPLDKKITFEYMCFCLEKIRNAILWSDSEQYQNMINYVNNVLNDIDQQTKYRLDTFLDISFNGFVTQINKAFLGLEKVENLPLATVQDGVIAAGEDVRIVNFERNKYVALDAIVSFKNTLHDFFLSSEGTNIGKARGVVIAPTRASLFDMLNGSVGILASKEQNTTGAIVFDEDVYPTDATPQNTYSVFKLTNNPSNRGGVFISSDRDNGNMYIGIHLTGVSTVPFVWRKVIFNKDSDELANVVSEHLLDINNPHGTNKHSVGLNLIENIEPITADEVLCLEQCRKYVTYDAFLLFMKTFMVNEQAAAEDPRNQVTGTDKVQIIYSKAPPVNMSACDPDTPPPPPPPPVPPEPFVIDRESVSISNILTDRALDLTIAHVKGKVPVRDILVTGILPAGITVFVDTDNPVFGVYSVKLTGTPTEAGIYSFGLSIVAVSDELLDLPVEFNVESSDQTGLKFISTHTTITRTTTESLTIILSGGPVNSTVRVKAVSRYVSTSVNEDLPPQIEKIVLIKTNSIGNGSISFPGGNASGSIQPGEWENWAQTLDITPAVISPIFVRIFT